MSYPLTRFSLETRITPRASVSHAVAADGTVRGRLETERDVYDATLVHTEVTLTELAALRAHYDANRTANIAITVAERDYALQYVSEPDAAPMGRAGDGGTRWKVTVKMVGNRSV